MTQPQLKTMASFNVQGISIRTRNADEGDMATAKIPALWQQFYQAHALRQLGWPHDAPGMYGVYSGYESDMNGLFDVTAAVPASDAPPAALRQLRIEGGDYLVFSGHGPMPQTVIEVWGQIWAYFSQATPEFLRRYTTDFEEYRGPEDVAIHIAVKR